MDDMLQRCTPTPALVGVLDITCTPVIIFTSTSCILIPGTQNPHIITSTSCTFVQKNKILVVSVIGFPVFLKAFANLSMVNTVVAFIISCEKPFSIKSLGIYSHFKHLPVSSGSIPIQRLHVHRFSLVVRVKGL